MRTSFLLLAVALATVGCGDDTGGTGGTAGSGGGSTSTGDTTSTTGSAGEGGAGSTTTGSGGTGQGGGATTSSTGGFEPADTVQEACENFNALTAGIGDELGCTVAVQGDCDAPVESCEPELLAFFNCLVANTSADDCICEGGGEGGAGGGGDLNCEAVAGSECGTENDAFVACAGL